MLWHTSTLQSIPFAPPSPFCTLFDIPTPLTTIPSRHLPITLRHPFQLVLLLNRITISRALGRIDKLLSKTLGDALDVAEGRLARADGEQRDGLVDTAQRRYVDCLAAHCAGGSDPSAVLARPAVDDRVDGDLDGVLVG